MGNNKGFTLVELIVTIAIISILAVVGGLTLTQWVGKARDTQVVSNINTVAKGLDMYYIQNGEYPEPDNYTGVGIKQGEWGSGKSSEIEIIPHPTNSDKSSFTYTITEDKEYYTIAGWLENELVMNGLYTDKLYARNNYKDMVLYKKGNIKIPVIVKEDNWVPVNNTNSDGSSFIVLGDNSEIVKKQDGTSLSGDSLDDVFVEVNEYNMEQGISRKTSCVKLISEVVCENLDPDNNTVLLYDDDWNKQGTLEDCYEDKFTYVVDTAMFPVGDGDDDGDSGAPSDGEYGKLRLACIRK